MTESTETSSPHDSHSRNGFFKSNLYLTYFRPAIYIAVAILLPVAAQLFHAGTLVAVFGALCVILLTISKTWRLRVGLFPSMVCLLLMVMVNLWHWADSFFISIYTGNIVTDKPFLPGGLVEGLITLTALWCYHTLLKHLNMRITQEWFVKKSQLKFIKGLFFFQMFLIFFWIAGLIVHTFKAGTHYDEHLATLVAGVIALFAAGIPALIYLVRNQDPHSKHHRHRHHHHHHSEE